ncbi:MAG: transglutaminase family protein [Akkermansia sp.]
MRALGLLVAAGLMSAGLVAAELPAMAIPEDVRRGALEPELFLNEAPSDWRPQLAALTEPLRRACRSERETALAIAAHLEELTGVRYDMARRHPCMNPLEALREKKVSCTGHSILLAAALRAAGIPARLVMVLAWNHVPGNHTWVEAWVDGGWRMMEPNSGEFDQPWVLEAIGMLNPQNPVQRVYAVALREGELVLPLPWDRAARIPAEDVTERYMQLAQAWYRRAGLSEDCQRLWVDWQPRAEAAAEVQVCDAEGRVLSTATLPTPRDDVRCMARLTLPRAGECYLCVPAWQLRARLRATESPAQVLRLRAIAPEPQQSQSGAPGTSGNSCDRG